MRRESVTVQKCKKQMDSLGIDSQSAYHRVKLILKIYRDVVWVLSGVLRNCTNTHGNLEIGMPALASAIWKTLPQTLTSRNLRKRSVALWRVACWSM